MNIAGAFRYSWCIWLILLGQPLVAQKKLERSLTEAQWRLWLRLGHYQRALFGSVSTIDNPEFFFSANGQRDPIAELEATLKALQTGKPLVGPLSLDPLCAFPARAMLLKERLPAARQRIACPDFAFWQQELPLQSVSLVFASAYFGNPASMFGHTFLKLNQAPSSGYSGEPLLDYGVGFAAAADPGEGPLYILKGLSGAYAGVFQLQPYYNLVNEYGFAENRDLFEYELRLDEQQKQWFLAHLWELYANARVDYYFFDDNCSYLLLELLDVLFPEKRLAEQAGFFVTPLASLQIISQTLPVQRLSMRSSLYRQTKDALAPLSLSHRQRVIAMVDGAGPIPSVTDQEASVLLDASLKLLQFEKSQLAFAQQDSLRTREYALLAARSRLGVRAQVRQPELSETEDPRLSHPARKWQLGVRQQHDSDAVLSMRLRYGFHDLLDPLPGYHAWSQLNVFDLALWQAAGHQLFYRAVLAEVLSLAPVNALKAGWSWTLKGGLQRSEADRRHQFWGQGGGGLSYEWLDQRLLTYVMPQMHLQGPESWAQSWALHTEIGLVWRWNRRFASHLFWQHIRADQQEQRSVQGLFRLALANNWQALAQWQYDSGWQSEFGIGRLF